MEGKRRKEQDETTQRTDTKETKTVSGRSSSHVGRLGSYASNVFAIETIEENTRIIGDFILQYINMPNIEVYIYGGRDNDNSGEYHVLWCL